MCVILCAVIEFLPAELKARLSQIREQDEDLQSREISIHVHVYAPVCVSFSSEFQVKGLTYSTCTCT